ncbi:MAG: hypothetical protein IT378_27710 [Sandaracinaceae bacterium]|nr:hypothetical protein [Sandaracinaceae bacterium]
MAIALGAVATFGLGVAAALATTGGIAEPLTWALFAGDFAVVTLALALAALALVARRRNRKLQHAIRGWLAT